MVKRYITRERCPTAAVTLSQTNGSYHAKPTDPIDETQRTDLFDSVWSEPSRDLNSPPLSYDPECIAGDDAVLV